MVTTIRIEQWKLFLLLGCAPDISRYTSTYLHVAYPVADDVAVALRRETGAQLSGYAAVAGTGTGRPLGPLGPLLGLPELRRELLERLRVG